MSNTQEPLVFKDDICKALKVGPICINRWLKKGKLPKPDVDLSQRTQAWKPSTLRAAGFNLF